MQEGCLAICVYQEADKTFNAVSSSSWSKNPFPFLAITRINTSPAWQSYNNQHFNRWKDGLPVYTNTST
ncbi:hypothetical protein E2C01_047762 [Portunus trituberculatus]|uniref:Uncharacterized protein n=1 Tax=Portunus trituberculatus TaxID=210409 RepID=A0A5B7G8C7_PORTR|nr:hypothetical protein [Portunus trituberculatus]